MKSDKLLKLFRAPQRDPSALLHVQIAQQVREIIRSQAIPSGTRLPSMRAIAGEWEANTMTVRQALMVLEKEGLLVSRHGKGTFVRERTRKLQTVALYYYGGVLRYPETRFLRAVHQCLLDRIDALGMRWEIWNDPRPKAEYKHPWPALVEAIRNGDVDAVISPCIDIPHFNWLTQLPTPVAFCGSHSLKNCVSLDLSKFAQLAVDALARQGCKSIGLISPFPSDVEHPTIEGLSLLNTFMNQAGKRKLRTRDAWVVTPDRMKSSSPMSSEEWGYKAFMRIWDRPDHPEGLVVCHDSESLGVTMAVLKKGIRVPEDLRLVYHKHAEVDLFCPLPVTCVVSKADDMAAGLLDHVQREFEGEKAVPAVLGFEVTETPGEIVVSENSRDVAVM